MDKNLLLYGTEQLEKPQFYDEWFMGEVAKGVKSAREQPLIKHEDAVRQVRAIITRAQAENVSHLV